MHDGSAVDISLSAGSHGHSSQSSVEELLPDGRTIETTNRSASGGSDTDVEITVHVPRYPQTLAYHTESHTTTR